METKELAAFLCQISYSNLSEETIATARMTLLDILGVAIAGSATPEGKIWQQHFLSYSTSEPSATVWQNGLPSAGYRQAAGINAAFGHILDFDDVHNLAIAHLGVVTVPGSLAIAQSRHCSGREWIAALAAGFEIGARVGHAINPSAYEFWHTTAVVGSLSTCGAVGRLLHLTPEQMCNALGSAGTQAAGLWEFMKDGAMSKPLHTANATLCGIRSAELSKLGLTGASHILEGRQGLLRALSREFHPERLTASLGESYMLSSNSFKLYPCCRHIHSAIYNMVKLLSVHKITPEQVMWIRSYTYDTALQLTDRPSPATPYARKFSMQYCLSAVLFRGGYHSDIFEPDDMDLRQTEAIMRKVQIVTDPEINKKIQQDASCWANRLEIQLTDHRILVESTDYPPGDSHVPLTWQQAVEKFYNLTFPVLGETSAERLADNVSRLEKMSDMADLFSCSISCG